MERDATGRLQADPVRFPNGIKYLADYVRYYSLTIREVTSFQRVIQALVGT